MAKKRGLISAQGVCVLALFRKQSEIYAKNRLADLLYHERPRHGGEPEALSDEV